MKKIFTVLFVSFTTIASAQNSTVLYLNFVSHNEENPSLTTGEPNWSNTFVYQQYRGYIKAIADTINANGGKWNWQSDWKFLSSVLDTNKETTILKNTTNNMTIVNYLEWLTGVEVDAHAHQTSHNYADVAKLLDSLGISAITVGGFLYDTVLTPIVPGKNWTDFETGINGVTYPSFFWQPEILWGASSMNHTNDINNYGAWRPDTIGSFMNDDPNHTMLYLGNGCKVVLDSGFVVANVIQDIANAINGLNANFSSSDFYSATIMMNQRNFDEPGVAGKIGQIIRGLNTYVSQGKLVWMTLSEKKDEWNNSFGNPSDADCQLVVPSVNDNLIDKHNIRVYPNPATNNVTFEMLNYLDNYFIVELYDLQGRLVKVEQGANNIPIELNELLPGLYNYIVKNKESENTGRGKLSVTE